MKFKSSILLLAAVLFISCSKKEETTTEEPAATTTTTTTTTTAPSQPTGGDDCMYGTYEMPENGVVRSFKINSDGTGAEIYTAEDVRPFKWTKTDQGLKIKYDNDTSGKEWNLTVNCDAKTLSWYGAVYKKV